MSSRKTITRPDGSIYYEYTYTRGGKQQKQRYEPHKTPKAYKFDAFFKNFNCLYNIVNRNCYKQYHDKDFYEKIPITRDGRHMSYSNFVKNVKSYADQQRKENVNSLRRFTVNEGYNIHPENVETIYNSIEYKLKNDDFNKPIEQFSEPFKSLLIQTLDKNNTKNKRFKEINEDIILGNIPYETDEDRIKVNDSLLYDSSEAPLEPLATLLPEDYDD